MHYDGKEYVESFSKVRREKSTTGALQIGESVTVKTKSRVQLHDPLHAIHWYKTILFRDTENCSYATRYQLTIKRY